VCCVLCAVLRDGVLCCVVPCCVVWCGVVLCGVVWCGAVSYDEVWCGVWCGVVLCMVWCGVVWCGVVWCGVVWCGVVWCGVVRCDVVRSGRTLFSEAPAQRLASAQLSVDRQVPNFWAGECMCLCVPPSPRQSTRRTGRACRGEEPPPFSKAPPSRKIGKCSVPAPGERGLTSAHHSLVVFGGRRPGGLRAPSYKTNGNGHPK
jgi:hypothetical protein